MPFQQKLKRQTIFKRGEGKDFLVPFSRQVGGQTLQRGLKYTLIVMFVLYFSHPHNSPSINRLIINLQAIVSSDCWTPRLNALFANWQNPSGANAPGACRTAMNRPLWRSSLSTAKLQMYIRPNADGLPKMRAGFRPRWILAGCVAFFMSECRMCGRAVMTGRDKECHNVRAGGVRRDWQGFCKEEGRKRIAELRSGGRTL